MYLFPKLLSKQQISTNAMDEPITVTQQDIDNMKNRLEEDRPLSIDEKKQFYHVLLFKITSALTKRNLIQLNLHLRRCAEHDYDKRLKTLLDFSTEIQDEIRRRENKKAEKTFNSRYTLMCTFLDDKRKSDLDALLADVPEDDYLTKEHILFDFVDIEKPVSASFESNRRILIEAAKEVMDKEAAQPKEKHIRKNTTKQKTPSKKRKV